VTSKGGGEREGGRGREREREREREEGGREGEREEKREERGGERGEGRLAILQRPPVSKESTSRLCTAEPNGPGM
jgi:hypothetical protein